MNNKRHIFYFLMLIAMIVIIAPAIPHHHHGNGVICMKNHIEEDHCCPMHHHHHHENDDPCCTNDCLSHFNSLIPPSFDTNEVQPQFLYVVTLFTEPLLQFLSEQEERTIHRDYVYVESLHGTYITRAAGLRAPPSPLS